MRLLQSSLTALTIGAAAVALAGCSLLPGGNGGNPSGGETPAADGETVDVFTVKVGDCLNDGGVEGEVSETVVIDCAEPHDSEAYASIMIEDGDFPGDDVVADRAVTECTTEFNAFVGLDYQASSLDFAYYYPTQDSWANGDREILCLIVDPAGKVEGSLQGAAR
ncbi:MAG TPA: septum formation family protein [Rhodoglobus sp.]|nr:septum formation family protein [Rhodoglobus sp.]